MKLTFLGAAREVTGSCYLLQVGKNNILIDCGMEQGPNIYENQELPISASSVTATILTHSHIDHSGMLPALTKSGYRNKIYMTRPSRDLCRIMLLDSAKIQEFEAEWRNRKSKRSKESLYQPIYDSADVEKTIKLFRACEYDEEVVISSDVKIKFIDAGHLLGSASVEVTATENGVTKTIVFSGDIGNQNKPLIRNPVFLTHADYVIMESTYGDRLNEGGVDYVSELAAIISRTFARGGNVVIPTFAVGRMQEILYHIRKIKEEGLVKGGSDFPVYVDSPLAVEATTVFSKNLSFCYDDETKQLVDKGINPLDFKGLYMSVTTDESKMINADNIPKVILSASGMCEAGRIRHHLKHNLWKPNSTVVFVGYQVAGTLGRSILEGAREVKLFGEKIRVSAEIVQLRGTSSHADKDGLVDWIKHIEPSPTRVFVTHGEDAVAESFAKLLERQEGLSATAPFNGAVWDLTNNICVEVGNTVKIRKNENVQVSQPVSSQPYSRLIESLDGLNNIVKNSGGATNENLRRLTKEIERLNEIYGLDK
ncbi:MAG: MBL fold metallo-hydrolase [Clostridia bacterium]